MDLLLEYRPLPCLSALCIGPPAIFGKDSLLPEVIQATLIFGVISPLRDARLAQEFGEVVAVLVLAMGFQAVMHSDQMLQVHGLQLHPAIQAIEDHYWLRVHKIAYFADAHKGGFGQPSWVNGVPEPKQGQYFCAKKLVNF